MNMYDYAYFDELAFTPTMEDRYGPIVTADFRGRRTLGEHEPDDVIPFDGSPVLHDAEPVSQIEDAADSAGYPAW